MPGRSDGGHGVPTRPRRAFLDGLRGLAALYVLLHHAAMFAPAPGLPPAATWARGLFRHGHYAVAVFIVVSGACLGLPTALDPLGRPPGGLASYLGRRARRILPPYYAALALCWALIALVPGLRHPGPSRWDRALPATGPRVVLSHLLLVHNLDERTIFRVDPPLWSVATEWQIYLVFPALLALSRRFGPAAPVAAGFALGAVAAALAPIVGNPALHQLCPWYVGLFALGMAAAGAASSRPEAPAPRRARLGWLLAIAPALVAPALVDRPARDVLIADPIVGAATAFLIARLARRRAGSPRPLAPRLLESRAAVGLGSFSYSLYLIHFPLLALAGSGLEGLGWSPTARLAAMLLVVAPACLPVAYLFHLAFERPTLPRRSGPTI